MTTVKALCISPINYVQEVEVEVDGTKVTSTDIADALDPSKIAKFESPVKTGDFYVCQQEYGFDSITNFYVNPYASVVLNDGASAKDIPLHSLIWADVLIVNVDEVDGHPCIVDISDSTVRKVKDVLADNSDYLYN